MRTAFARVAALALAGLVALPAAGDAATRRLIIATGGVTGVYYSVGKAICGLVNADTKKSGIRCVAEQSRGSAANVGMIRNGRAEVAIVQSDAQWHAYRGTGAFADSGPDRGLQGVMRLHLETFTVMVSKDSDIAHFAELRASLFGLASEASGARFSVRALAAALDWEPEQPRVVPNLRSRDLGRALCDRLVDVISIITGHPSHAVQEPVSTCGARIVPVTGPEIDLMIAAAPYFDPAVIPKKIYANVDGDIPSFATRAVIVAASHVPANVVYELVRAVMRNPGALRKAHPALAELAAADMAPRAVLSPVHEGAARWFRENDRK